VQGIGGRVGRDGMRCADFPCGRFFSPSARLRGLNCITGRLSLSLFEESQAIFESNFCCRFVSAFACFSPYMHVFCTTVRHYATYPIHDPSKDARVSRGLYLSRNVNKDWWDGYATFFYYERKRYDSLFISSLLCVANCRNGSILVRSEYIGETRSTVPRPLDPPTTRIYHI
jgi:hypothetical protein